MLGHFRRITSLLGNLDDSSREKLASLEERLFPGAPAMQFSPTTAAESTCSAQLKKTILGMHEFHDTFHSFPGADRAKSGDLPGLSWRVHILPFVSEKPLHDQFVSFKETGSLRPPEEVAQLAVFLASDHSVGISGEIGGEAEYRDYGYGLED